MTTADVVKQETGKTAAAKSILNRSVCLILRCGYLGNHRRVELANVDMKMKRVVDGEDGTLDREKDEMGATKRLFGAKDLTPCNAAINAVKLGLRAMSIDGGQRVFGSGAYLIPLLAISKAEELLVEGKANVAVRAQELVDRLPRLLEERRKKLGPLFNIAEYPTEDDVLAAYSIDWNYVSFSTPEMLEEVDRAAYERAVTANQERLSQAFDDAVLGLRATALKVVRELADRLTPDTDGKPKVLRGTALRDLQELVEALPVLNSVGEDDALVSALSKVGALAQGLDAETLRKADGIRTLVQSAAADAVLALDALVQTGRRGIRFGSIGE